MVGRARIGLGGEAWLTLDTGPDPAAGAALALLERGPGRLLLLFGEAAATADDAIARGALPPPTAVARLTPATAAPPASLRPALVITLDEGAAGGADGPRRLALAAGEAVRVVLKPDRLIVQGEAVRATLAP